MKIWLKFMDTEKMLKNIQLDFSIYNKIDRQAEQIKII